MLSLRNKRAIQGKATEFQMNRKSVNLDNYLKRTRTPSSRLLSVTNPSGELPRYIQCRTPPRIAKPLCSPGLIRLEELVLVYYQSLDPSTASLLPRVDYPNIGLIWGVAQVFKQLHLASWLFSECHNVAAGRQARSAFAKLDSLHRATFPQFLLFSMYASSVYPISMDLILYFWKYIAIRAKDFQPQEAIGTKLAAEIYKELRTRGSSTYCDLISETMLRVFELDTDEREVPVSYDLLGAMTMHMGDRDKWTAGTGTLIRRCVHRGMPLVGDKQSKSALQTYASSLENKDHIQQPNPLYRSEASELEPKSGLALNEWLYYSSLARIERERCEKNNLANTPRNDRACYYLERAIPDWLKSAESEPHIIMHLRMLEKWYQDDCNLLDANASREKSEKELQKIIQRSDLS